MATVRNKKHGRDGGGSRPRKVVESPSADYDHRAILQSPNDRMMRPKKWAKTT